MGIWTPLLFYRFWIQIHCTGRSHLLLLKIWRHGLPHWVNNSLLFDYSSKERRMSVFIPVVQQPKCLCNFSLTFAKTVANEAKIYLSEKSTKLWASRVSWPVLDHIQLLFLKIFYLLGQYSTRLRLGIRLQNSWPYIFLAQYFLTWYCYKTEKLKDTASHSSIIQDPITFYNAYHYCCNFKIKIANESTIFPTISISNKKY